MLSKITWGRFCIHKIADGDMDAAPILKLPYHRDASVRVYQTAIDQPAAQVAVEDFLPGEPIDWTFPHDEMQYCLSGSADLTISMPPLHIETIAARIEPGCITYFPSGSRMHLTVLNGEPCRHIAFCVPNPGYPFELADSIKTVG